MSFRDFDSRFFECEQHNDVAIARFRDPILTDELNIQQLGAELFAIAEQFHLKKVVLDLGNVQHLTSSVLGKIITMHRRLHRHGGVLALCAIGPEVADVLETSRLIDYFNCVKDVRSGIEHVNEGSV